MPLCKPSSLLRLANSCHWLFRLADQIFAPYWRSGDQFPQHSIKLLLVNLDRLFHFSSASRCYYCFIGCFCAPIESVNTSSTTKYRGRHVETWQSGLMLPPYKRAVGFSPEKQSPIRESESRRLRSSFTYSPISWATPTRQRWENHRSGGKGVLNHATHPMRSSDSDRDSRRRPNDHCVNTHRALARPSTSPGQKWSGLPLSTYHARQSPTQLSLSPPCQKDSSINLCQVHNCRERRKSTQNIDPVGLAGKILSRNELGAGLE
jgi:hypothetical protein